MINTYTCILQELTDIPLGNFCHLFEGCCGAVKTPNVVIFSKNAPPTVILSMDMNIQGINKEKDKENDLDFDWHLTPFHIVSSSARHTVNCSNNLRRESPANVRYHTPSNYE